MREQIVRLYRTLKCLHQWSAVAICNNRIANVGWVTVLLVRKGSLDAGESYVPSKDKCLSRLVYWTPLIIYHIGQPPSQVLLALDSLGIHWEVGITDFGNERHSQLHILQVTLAAQITVLSLQVVCHVQQASFVPMWFCLAPATTSVCSTHIESPALIHLSDITVKQQCLILTHINSTMEILWLQKQGILCASLLACLSSWPGFVHSWC